jgi:hypothetical protein
VPAGPAVGEAAAWWGATHVPTCAVLIDPHTTQHTNAKVLGGNLFKPNSDIGGWSDAVGARGRPASSTCPSPCLSPIQPWRLLVRSRTRPSLRARQSRSLVPQTRPPSTPLPRAPAPPSLVPGAAFLEPFGLNNHSSSVAAPGTRNASAAGRAEAAYPGLQARRDAGDWVWGIGRNGARACTM